MQDTQLTGAASLPDESNMSTKSTYGHQGTGYSSVPQCARVGAVLAPMGLQGRGGLFSETPTLGQGGLPCMEIKA